MMASFLTEVDGFTPVIDVVVDDVGLTAAAVYGAIWRYCQMKDKVCKASMETIGKRVGLSRQAIFRYIKILYAAGYLIDKTPNRRNAPHIYADAGRIKIFGLLSVKNEEIPLVDQCDKSLQQEENRCNESLQRCNESLQPGVTNHYKKIQDTKEDTNKRENKSPANNKLSEGQREFLSLFGAKRYKTRIQRDTILELEEEYSTDRLIELARWAAKRGLNVGSAVVAVEGALKRQSKQNGRTAMKVGR